jgi:bifunctional DNase/RNase
LLDEISGERSLPVMVGACEAHSIALALEYSEPPRPMTHDLIKAMVTESKGKINSVKITDLIDGVFYARIEIQGAQIGVLNLDSRPSDAIAIALRTEAPIFVDETVMDDSFQLEEENNTIGVEKFEIEEQKEELENNLRKAVEMEKYEEAAVIRDQLKEYD